MKTGIPPEISPRFPSLAAPALALLVAAFPAAAQDPPLIPGDAYLLRYSFDAGDAADDSGNGNGGAIVNAVPGEGRVGKALEFAGSDDSYVEVPDLGEFEDVTVAGWIKVSGRVGSWRAIYNVDGWSPGWLHHQLYPDNRMGFSIHSNPGSGNQFAATSWGEDMLEEWHHSAVVYSSSDGIISFYIDGELDEETDWAGGAAVLAPARLGGWDGGGRGFEGCIDEFVILGIAATEAQVKALAGEPAVRREIAEYAFDDGTGRDGSGNGHDAAIVGALAVEGEWFEGKALQFDGSDAQYVEVPDLGVTDDLTIAMWFQTTGRVGDWRALYAANGWSPGRVHYQIHPDNTVAFSINGNGGGNDRSGITAFDATQLGVWHHSAVVYSASEGKVRFYLDGLLEAERDWGGEPAVLGPARIGGWDGGGRGFQGLIDDVVIWRIAADGRQIARLMGDGRQPRPEGEVIAAYTFDDGTAVDASGNGFDGTVVAAQPVEGKLGRALEFDGSDAVYVETPDLGEHEELTITAWFKMTGKTGGWRVIYNVNGWSPGWVHHQIHPNNRIEYSIHSNPGGNDRFGEAFFDEAGLDAWHHTAVVYSASGQEIRFYIDGELDSEASWGGNPAILGEARIGGWDGGGRGFEGLLDEVYLLGFAATQEEIRTLMENGLSPPGLFQIERASYTPAANGAPPFVELTWRSRAGATYAIETSGNLGQYVELTDGFESQGDETTFKHENPAGPEQFYRVRQEN